MISVITPCYNIVKDGRKEYFDKMMQSIHEQSYKDFEHIVIDDGSTDGTLDILRFYKQKGWINQLIISEKNEGIYPTSNKGIKIAKGDFIHIMNTDDYVLDKDFFKISIELIEKNNADFSHADRIIKSRIGMSDMVKRGNERSTFFRMPFRHQTMLVNKSVFDEIGLFDEKYKIASDYKFIIQMIIVGKKGVYIPKIFICSLDGGASSNREKCIKEVSNILFETYGQKYGLTEDDCKNIYIRKFSIKLIIKIFKINYKKIKSSLIYGLFHSK